ncbi:hypothetical protein GmHk_19G054756 [Glycine max]|nr:hypothetical protein GmHk_19G054756 [Glycine max]
MVTKRCLLANGVKKKEGETHVATAVPTWPSSSQTPHNPMYLYPPHQYHYSANIGPPPCPTPLRSRAPNQLQRPPQHHPQNPFPIQPRPNATPNPNINTNPRRNFPERKPVKFTPIPMLYADLLPSLLSNQMVVVSPGRDSPNLRTNPLVNQGSSSMNAIEKRESLELMQIKDVSSPKRFILEALHKDGMLHPGELHDVETCPVSKELLQGLIDGGRIEIGRVRREEGEVFMQSSDTNLGKPKPLVIHFTKDVTTQDVPWRFGIKGSDGRQDVSGMNGMSRSRHIFAPPELPANSKGKRKEKEDAVEREKIGPVANNETLIGKLAEEEGNFGKKEISAEATIEFLRII